MFKPLPHVIAFETITFKRSIECDHIMLEMISCSLGDKALALLSNLCVSCHYRKKTIKMQADNGWKENTSYLKYSKNSKSDSRPNEKQEKHSKDRDLQLSWTIISIKTANICVWRDTNQKICSINLSEITITLIWTTNGVIKMAEQAKNLNSCALEIRENMQKCFLMSLNMQSKK